MAIVRGVERRNLAVYPGDLPPPKVFQLPTAEEKREVSERLLVMLSRCKNPETGRIYTSEELSEIFHLRPRVIERKLRTNGIFHQPIPVVHHDQLPENERAFFTGLSRGDFQIKPIHWRNSDFIMIGTESERPYKRELLKQTIGTWGEIHENDSEIRIYVDSPTFDFMAASSVETRMLDAKSRLAPLVLGGLAARLSKKDNRFSLKDTKLLERIHRRFERHFGFSMGRFEIEHRNGSGGEFGVITLKDPGRVLTSLIALESVCTLPFFRSLAQLG